MFAKAFLELTTDAKHSFCAPTVLDEPILIDDDSCHGDNGNEDEEWFTPDDVPKMNDSLLRDL
eukprot:8240356-Karenia_brevis.AAC.1